MRFRLKHRLAAFAATAGMLATVVGWTAPAGAATKSVPGVTPSSITIGEITVLTGPVPGLFAGALHGVQAYVAYINSKGGVNGRKLVLKSGDDGYSCATNSSQTQSLAPQVFAFVGNFSVFDGCGAAVLAKQPTIPDVSYPLTDQAKALPNLFSPEPAPAGFEYGSFQWVKQHYPSVTKVGGLYTSAAQTEWNEQIKAMGHAGLKLTYGRAVQPTDTQFTSDVIRMRNSGVQLVWLTDVDVAQNAQFLDAAYQQNWHPKVVLLSTAYDPNFFKLVNPKAVNGDLFREQFALFQGEDAKSTPEVALFLKWLNKVAPGFKADLYTMYSWASAALFVQALKSLGKNPTQAGLLAALKKTHHFNDNGMLPYSDVGRKKPPTCYLVGHIENGKWIRIAPPKKGFICKPGGYSYGG